MPREVGSEGVDNISGIAWDDINKVNAIQKDNIDKFSGYQTGQEFVWGQQAGVYLFTSFQVPPTSDWSSDTTGGPPDGGSGNDWDNATPSYGNYPDDSETAGVGNVEFNLGKTVSGGDTGWLHGDDQFYNPTSDNSLISRNHHIGSFSTPPNGIWSTSNTIGHVQHNTEAGGPYEVDDNLNIEINVSGLGTLTRNNLKAVHATSNGWVMGYWGKTPSGTTGLDAGQSGLNNTETGSGFDTDGNNASNTSAKKLRRYAYVEASYDGQSEIFTLRTPKIDFRSGSATSNNKLEFWIKAHANGEIIPAGTLGSLSFEVQATTGDDPYFLSTGGVKTLEATYATRSLSNGYSVLNQNPSGVTFDSTLLELSGSVQGDYDDPFVKVTIPLQSSTKCFRRSTGNIDNLGEAGTLFDEDFYIRFVYETAANYRSDIAIDNVKIYGTPT